MDPTHSNDSSSPTSGPAQDAPAPRSTATPLEASPPDATPGGAAVTAPAREKRWTVSRRAFTVRLGAALLAAPFVELLLPRKARAATTPKRLVVFFTPNGTAPARYWPTGSETSFTFPAGSILEPLKSHQQEMLIVKGLEFGEASNHAGGMAAQLTNNGGNVGGSDSKGMSVDQYVASSIGGTTRLKSLELGVQTSIWGAGQQTRMCYRSLTEYAPPDDDPVSVYGRIFGSGGGGASTADPETLRRKSVIDAVKGDLSDLRARLGAEEARKLDQHLNSIRELEHSMGVVACSGGTPPTAVAKDQNDNFPTIGKTQLDLLVSALGCGATNVASLQWTFTVSPVVFSWLGITDQHHTLSHNGDGDTAGVQKWVDCERWFAQQFAYLLEQLAKTPDPAGGTLLDSTLVFWTKEMGDGRLHESKNVPFILAGGGGAFNLGRYVQTTGKFHGQLLVSICHAMGLTNATFGNPKYGTGPLAGL